MNANAEADALRVTCAELERERDRARCANAALRVSLDLLAACRRELRERAEAHEEAVRELFARQRLLCAQFAADARARRAK